MKEPVRGVGGVLLFTVHGPYNSLKNKWKSKWWNCSQPLADSIGYVRISNTDNSTLKLIYTFQTRHGDSWYSYVPFRKRTHSIFLIKKSLILFTTKQYFGNNEVHSNFDALQGAIYILLWLLLLVFALISFVAQLIYKLMTKIIWTCYTL